MPKQTLSGNAARAALMRGVDAVANAVKQTLGPRGRNVLLDRPGQPLATRDGVTVAKEVSWLPDPFENMGAAYAREVADAAVTEAGDGTTTATVLLQAIVREGMKLVSEGAEPLLLADGIKLAADECVKTIRSLSIEATPELVRQAAIISTHGDVDLGTMIAEATCKVGATGVLELQESRDEHTTIEHMEGYFFERGWRPMQFFTNDKTGQKAVVKNPLILISERIIVGAGLQNGKFVAGDGIASILQQCITARRALVIIAEDLLGDALNLFTSNLAAGQLVGGCFVKLPGFGDQREAAIEDLRIAVGAARIHTKTSTRVDDTLSTFKLDDLGFCEQAVIAPTRTVLLGPGGHEANKNRRIKQLITQSQEETNPFARESLDHRIARLSGGVAVLRVGAHSEPAMLEKRARAEDAIHACRGALQEGVVPGGGVALLRSGLKHANLSINPGCKLLLSAIKEPACQIIRNAGIDHIDPGGTEGTYDPTGGPYYTGTVSAPALGAEEIVTILEAMPQEVGLNSATGELSDMIHSGIIDPTKVVITALTKAASIGALLLTTEVLCTEIPNQQQPAPVPAALRM